MSDRILTVPKRSVLLSIFKMPKWLSFVLLFVALVLAPVLVLFLDRVIQPAQSWYDNAWEFRKQVTITNSGAQRLNYDVSVEVDTAALIADNKIQADCDDIRFVDSDDSTNLQYWIEGGCNTANTQVWVRIPTLPTGEKTIYMYYGNGSVSSTQEAWSGSFTLLANAACPAGWTRNADFDGRFPYGSATYGTTGGNSTHNMANLSGTTSGVNNTALGRGGTTNTSLNVHTHTYTLVFNAANNLPPYLKMSFCSSSKLDIVNPLVSLFDSSVPANWTQYAALDGRFPLGDATPGETGGATTHPHTIVSGNVSSVNAEIGVSTGTPNSNRAFGTPSHNHSYSGSTAAATSLPPYLTMIYGQADNSSASREGMIAMVNQLPPFGWTRFTALDSKFPYGNTAYGSTGGTTTHTHSVSFNVAAYTQVRLVMTDNTDSYKVVSNHYHSISGTTASANHVPAYLTTIFAKRNSNSTDGVSLSLLTEESNVPIAPGMGGPQALSTSTIRWNITDNSYNEVGFKILDSLGNVKVTCDTPDITYCDETGLQPNTQYTRKVVAYNANGDSDASAEVSRYTLNSVPVLSITNPSTTGMTISATNAFNLDAGSSGLYFDCTSTNCDTGINVWSDSTSAVMTGLNPNTSYSFWVKSRNGDGVESALSDLVTLYTYAEVPTLAPSLIFPTTIGLNITNASNLNQGQSGAYFECISPSCPGGADTWVTSVPRSLTSLEINTQYNIRVKVRNGNGIETAYQQITLYSGVNGPVVAELTPTGTDSVRVIFSGNGNPANTQYSMQEVNTGKYVDINGSLQDTETWATYAEWGSVTGLVVTGFTPGAEVNMVISARNGDNVASLLTGEGVTYTKLSTPELISGTAVSGSSIDWSFTDTNTVENGFRVIDQNGTTVATCLTPNATECTETGLTPNTEYIRRIVAFNNESVSDPSTEQSAITLANVPSLDNFVFGEGQVSFDPQMNGNPSEVQLLIQEEITGKYVDTVSGTLVTNPYWFSYQTSSGAINVTGLDPNTEYRFKVKARNSELVQTAYSTSTSVNTYAEVPEITDINIDGSAISMLHISIDNKGNPANTEVLITETSTNKYLDNSSHGLVDNPVWTAYSDLPSIYVSGLSVNTQYTFKVKARNADSVETAYSSSVSKYTMAQGAAPVSLVSNSPTSLIYSFDPTSNPSYTEYMLFGTYSMAGSYVGLDGNLQETAVWGTYEQWGGVSGIGITGLSPDVVYSFGVRARNIDGEETTMGRSESINGRTLSNTPGTPDSDTVGINSLNIVIDTNGNPATTTYALYNETTSKYINYTSGNDSDTAVWGTYEQWGSGNGITISGLSSGTEYIFVAKARNGDNVETGFSLGSNVSTSLAAPTIGTPELLSSSSIRWNFTDNEGNEVGYRVFDENGVQKSQCVGNNLTSCIEYGLTPNTSYTRKVAAYSATGGGEFSNTVTVVTPAASPEILSLTSVSSTQLNLKLTINSNPSNTEYLIQETVSGLYVNKVSGELVSEESWGTYTDFGGENGENISRLFANAQYGFKVRARNQNNVVTDFSMESLKYTLAVKTLPPIVVATSDSKIKVSMDNGGNPAVTQFALKEKVVGKYYNISSGLFESIPTWNTYTQWRGSNGFEVSGLGTNTQYEFEVYSRNGEGEVSEASDTVKAFTLATIPGRAVVNNRTESTLSISLNPVNNPSTTEYALIESRSARYVDFRTGELVSSAVWGKFSDWGGTRGISVRNLRPGSPNEFIVKAKNGDGLETLTSSSSQSYTLAAVPGVSALQSVTTRSMRIVINALLNDPSVQYSIYEESLRKYVNKVSGLLQDDPDWGTYSEFGGDRGIIATELSPVTDYSFRINARNVDGVVTGLGARRISGTNAVIMNVPSTLTLVLSNNENINPTSFEGAQRGLRNIKVKTSGLLVADIPIDFDQDKDWSMVDINTDPLTYRSVVKLPTEAGLKGTYTMYVAKGDTNRFKLCPKAETLLEVNTDCAGSVVFAGPYPQKTNINGKDVTVSTSIINEVAYWVVSGLTGTGGLGEVVDTSGEVIPPKEPAKEEPQTDEEEEKKPVIVRTVNRVVEVVSKAVPVQTEQAIEGVKVVLDNTVGALPEEQFTAVSTTATVATVTVGMAAVGGGFTSIPYYITQVIFSILSFFGFRKKGKPYGYVYDSVTKEAVTRAVVRIYDINERLVWTDVTDGYGSFSAEIGKGKYKLLVKKAGYIYPTTLIKGLSDYPLEPVYKGSMITLDKRRDVNMIVPIDPVKVKDIAKFNVSAKSSAVTVFKLLHIVIFVAGLSVAIYGYSKYPNLLNLGVIGLYIPSFIMLISSLFKRKSAYGLVIDVNGKPVGNVEIAVKELKFDRYIAKRVTDKYGRYKLILYPGTYEISLVSDEYKVVKYGEGSNIVSISEKGSKVIAKKITVKKK